jgi:hypothetical protein
MYAARLQALRFTMCAPLLSVGFPVRFVRRHPLKAKGWAWQPREASADLSIFQRATGGPLLAPASRQGTSSSLPGIRRAMRWAFFHDIKTGRMLSRGRANVKPD